MVLQAYRARTPKASPRWQCLQRTFDRFLEVYEDRYQSRYGFLRRIIPEVVHKFLDCGDLERGFARIRCDHCRHEYLLAFSCKGRWSCPSCHQKKVQLFGALVTETILFPVPHRHVPSRGLGLRARVCGSCDAVWIDFFANRSEPQVAALERLMEEGEDLCIRGVILTEVLHAIRPDASYTKTRRCLEALLYVPPGRGC